MSDHVLDLAGPYPYFDTPWIWFAKCSCGKYSSGKVFSREEAIARHKQHAKSKTDNEESSSAWDTIYERQLKNL